MIYFGVSRDVGRPRRASILIYEPRLIARIMSVTRHTSRWCVAPVLLGVAVLFYWRILFTNRWIFPWDAADQFYPSFAFVHEELRHFRLPLWDPYIMSGY